MSRKMFWAKPQVIHLIVEAPPFFNMQIHTSADLKPWPRAATGPWQSKAAKILFGAPATCVLLSFGCKWPAGGAENLENSRFHKRFFPFWLVKLVILWDQMGRKTAMENMWKLRFTFPVTAMDGELEMEDSPRECCSIGTFLEQLTQLQPTLVILSYS